MLFNLKEIPTTPGVYIMRDSAARIIYIGKAGNLRNRLGFYAKGEDVGPKIQAMLESLRQVEYVECANEREALLLEEKWIKKYQPVFNAMWKDDKSYPYVVLTMQEDFPRIYRARRKHLPPGALAFGPYPEMSRIKGLLQEMFRSGVIPLRPCDYEFSLKNPLPQKVINSCMYFHSGQCPAPCAGKISPAQYRGIAKKAEYLFSGKHKRFESALRVSMRKAAKNLEFERADAIKRHLEALSHIRDSVHVSAVLKEDLDNLYLPEIALQSLRKTLGMARLPAHIEGFDISNLSGTFSVGSMVCFTDGRPFKNHYRHFRIKTVEGINDFAMMNEIVRRRYARVEQEGETMADVVLIDGGLGQLGAAKKAFEGLKKRPVLCSLAKQEETLYLDAPEGFREIKLPKSDEGLKLCMWIRDEAHRFAITYHKNLRRKGFLDQNG